MFPTMADAIPYRHCAVCYFGVGYLQVRIYIYTGRAKNRRAIFKTLQL